MKTIFIITTRVYPRDNAQFEPVIENYVTSEMWRDNFEKLWGSSSDNPIKKLVIGSVIFYVAPCMRNDHKVAGFEYLKVLIKVIKEDIRESDYQLFLIAHDKDYAITKQPYVRAFSIKDNGLKSFAKQVFRIDQNLCGFISYQHEQTNNLEVQRVDGTKILTAERDQSNTFYLNDIYDCFIKYLNHNDGINIDNCRYLQNILLKLDLEVDFNIVECERNIEKNNHNTVKESSFSVPYEICELFAPTKEDIKKIYKRNVHTDKPMVMKLPCPLGELKERDINFYDSSIWHYAYHNDEELQWIEEQINANSERYKLKKAREYKEFYSRMWEEDYFDSLYGDHAEYVIPFLFHSEQKLHGKLKKQKYTDIKAAVNQYMWRILLVDDHSVVDDHSDNDKKMDVFGVGTNTLTKLDIVKTELEKLFKVGTVATKKEEITKDTFIYIDCASKLEDAKTALQNKKYEIILLDYLLGGKGDGREYGYELLKGIWAKEENKAEDVKYKDYIFDYKKGPDNRFYFMFISAFTTAVSERLLAEGWARSEEYWYIGEGACPINTPYLFQYRLLHIMEKRMKEMGLTKWNLKKQEEQNDSSKNENAKKKPFACLLKTIHETFTKEVVEDHNNIYTDLIKEIYSSKDEARQRANEKFQDVLDFLYHYKSLIKDTHITENCFDSNESVLATEFIKKHMNYEGVLEHLTQLVYLTAFGTVRQWPEMWEEYQYIKSVLGKIEEVEIYIVNLKNNSAK